MLYNKGMQRRGHYGATKRPSLEGVYYVSLNRLESSVLGAIVSSSQATVIGIASSAVLVRTGRRFRLATESAERL